MKKVLLLVTVLGFFGGVFSQNVFDPNDPIVRYSSSAAYGSSQKPDSLQLGLQKWVSVSTNGVSSGSGSFNASSFKAYFINWWNNSLPFRLKYPKSFNDSANKKYPVMLFMHGAGEVGCPSNGGIYNNEKQLVHGGKLFMDRVDNNEFDGFLLYPQLRSKDGNCWGEWGGGPNANYNTIVALLDTLAKYVRLDIDRVFVDGLSGGGVACWRLAESYPTRIAKIAPTSAAGLLMDYPAFVHIPIWLATGGRDTNPSPEMAAYSESKVTELGGVMRRSLYADLGHSSWYRHWQEADFVPYMNDAHKANPMIFFDRFEFCEGDPINARLGITPGFNAYEWEREGQLIATRYNGVNTIVNSSHVISFTGNEITVRSFGTYRVRFRRVNNGEWSAWSPKPAVIQQKAQTQTPPIQVSGVRSKVLPSLDGKNSVLLELPAGFLNYQWVRTTDNAVVSTTQFYEAPIGTYKARYTEPFGCGTLYSPDFRVVSATGTPKPDPAKNLSVAALSQTSLRLDWSDNPNAALNETAFEVYRATKAGGPYTLVGITLPNVVTYQDTALAPNTNYYYLVRAVSETGAAENSNQGTGRTEIDDQAPTAPADLEYRGSTITTVSLRWKASTDNIGIQRYDIYANGAKQYSTTGLSFTVGNLDSLTSYTFVVKAVDKAGNESPQSNQVIGYTHRPGLNYKYYHGTYSNLPNFNSLTPVSTGITSTANTGESIRTQTNSYAFLWEGYIYIPQTAQYTFGTYSNEGSKLYIDVPYSSGATAVVNNDGTHSATLASGSVTLTQGYHSIAITYFENSGSETMVVYWTNNMGLPQEEIPAGFFTYESAAASTALTAPSGLFATATAYDRIELVWTDNSSNEAGFEIQRAASASGPFVSIKTTAANATSYVDSALAPSTTYHYRVRAISSEGESSYAASLVEANWKFNNNYDDEAGGPDADPNSTSFSSSDKAEGSHSVVFNSGSDYVSLGPTNSFPSLGPYSERTVAVWIKPTSTDSRRIIFELGGADDGLGLRFNSDDLVAGVASDNSRTNITLTNFVSNGNWLSGQWNHVAVVYSGTSLRLYLNGVSVASTTSLSFTSVGSSGSSSRIGDPSGTNSNNVFNDGSYTNFAGNMDDLYIIRAALSEADINQLRAFTYKSSSATTLAAPAAPSAPNGLSATVLSTKAIRLTWNDNSSNETSFEIWRASGDKSNNRRIATIPGGSGGQKTFTDSSLFANVTYYFRVRAVGEVNSSAFTSEVNAKTLNTKPVIKDVKDFTMRYGTTFVLPVTASDVDGDIMSFTTVSLPTFATVSNGANGVFNISFSPSITRRGGYNIAVIVSDGNGGADTTAFRLTVNNNDVPAMSAVQETATIIEGSQLSIPLSATDNNGTANMLWTFEGLPSFATFTNNNNGSGTLLFAPGYAASGEYEVTIFVNDGYGAWTSRTLLLTVTDTDPNDKIQFNFRTVSNAVAGWNSVNVVNPSFSHGAILDTEGNPSTVTLTLTSGGVEGTSNGPQSANNTGVYPNLVMKDQIRWGFNVGTNLFDTLVVRLAGLSVSKTYNLIFHSGYTFGGDAGSVTRFRVGAQTATVNYLQNISMTDTLENIAPNASGEIFVTMIGDPNITRGGMLNAMVVQSNFDDGSTPSKPLHLGGLHEPNTGVQLTWEDRAYNETGYSVFRSLNRNGGYTLLNSGATNKDSASYLDETAAPETTYYYYVAGFNGSGTGSASDTIQVITENNSPDVSGPGMISVKTDAISNTDYTISDDAGDIVTVVIEQKPAFVTLQHLGGSGYRLRVAPGTDHIGWYTVTLKATDDSGAETVRQIMVNVFDKNTRSVFINFGSATKPALAPWNNWLGFRGAGNSLANLVDETNTPSGFSITTQTAWNGLSDLGHITGNNSGIVPDSVLRSGLVDNNGGTKSILLSGLNNAMRYNIVIIGTQNEGTSPIIEYVSGSVKDTLNARYNTQLSANLNGLTPSGGQITFTATPISGSTQSFLNGLIIEEYDPSITLLSPFNLYAEPFERNAVDLSWSDRTNNEAPGDGYLLERALDSLFTLSVESISLPGNTTTYRNTGLTPNTKYWYRLRAKSGGIFSDYSNRAATITPSSIVKINFNYTLPDAPYPWNNTFASPTFVGTFDNLINQSGLNSGLTLDLTQVFNGEFTAGVNTGDNSGMVPDNALSANYWIDKEQVAEFVVSGLNHSRRYRFGFWGSSSSVGWFKSDYTATYTINGRTVYLNSWMNSSKIVYLEDVTPDENGQVILSISTTAQAAYGFNGGFIVEDYVDPNTPPIMIVNNSVLEDAGLSVENADDDESIEQRLASLPEGRMYPNPFTDLINLDFNNASASDKVSVEVYDLSGRLSYRRVYGQLPQGGNTLRLNSGEAGLGAGVYIITVSVNGKPVQAGKVIRTRK